MKKIEIVFGLLLAVIIINMTYLDLGYNSLLSKEPIPASTDPLSFDQNFPDMLGEKIQSTMSGEFVGKGVNADNITTGFLKFDRAKGGTLRLGGENNINGMFALADGEGNERITMDKDGMVINDGSVKIKDKNNTTIVDANGVTSANFRNFEIIQTGLNQIFTSNSFSAITNASLNINLTRPTTIIILYSSTVYLSGQAGGDWSGTGMVGLYIDGSEIRRARITVGGRSIGSQYENGDINVRSQFYIASLSTGAHSIALQAKIDQGGSANSQLTVVDYQLGSIKLGN